MSSKEWEEVEIQNICIVKRGASPRPIHDYISDKGIPWVKIADATYSNSRFISKTKEFIKKEGKEKSKYIQKGTLILSNSATPGIPKIMKIDACVHDGWLVIDNFKCVLKEFMYYMFIYERDKLVRLSTGSVFNNLKTDIVKRYKVNLPKLNNQKVIVKILSILDDKIELNNQINKNLEEMAQVIFKHWFIDFEFPNENGEPYKSSGGEMVDSEMGLIPKGWRFEKLGNLLSEIVTGNRPKGGVSKFKKGIPSIGAESINGLCNYDFSKTKYIPESYFSNMKKGIVKNGDILLYKDGAKIGRKSMFLENFPFKRCCVNSHVFILRSNSLMKQNYLYFYLDQKFMTKNIINLNTNSAQPGINSTSVKTLRILLPSDKTLNLFNELVFPILRIIFNNSKGNQCLSNLRDALLPKLMSGEIRVPINDKEGNE